MDDILIYKKQFYYQLDFSDDDFEKSLSHDSDDDDDDDMDHERENPEIADGMQSRGSKRDPQDDEDDVNVENEGENVSCASHNAGSTGGDSCHLNGHINNHHEAMDDTTGNLTLCVS